MAYLCAVDLGTSSVKTAIYDEQGKLCSFQIVDYRIIVPQIDYAEQVPEEWWKSVCLSIKKAILQLGANTKEIVSIGFSGQMHGIVALDRDGIPVRNSIIHVDQRSKKQVDYLKKIVLEESMISSIANEPATGFLLSSLLWIKENEPSVYDRIYKVISPKDYIRFKLTNEIGTEITDASATFAFDIEKIDWNYTLLDKCGISKEFFPKCNKPYQKAGHVTKKASLETTLNEGTTVVYGGADQTMQCLGNGIYKSNVITSTIGTGGQLLYTCENVNKICEKGINLYNNVLDGTWYNLGAIMSAGLALSWFVKEILEKNTYDNLDEFCDAPPVCKEGLFFFPYLVGSRDLRQRNLKGSFIGLTLKHNNIDMTRAVMEGVVFAMKYNLSKMKVQNVSYIIASGGSTKDKLWLQLQADIYGKPIQVARGDDQATLGAAILASIGCSLYVTVEEAIKNMVHMEMDKIVPNEINMKIFEERFEKYKTILNVLTAL